MKQLNSCLIILIALVYSCGVGIADDSPSAMPTTLAPSTQKLFRTALKRFHTAKTSADYTLAADTFRSLAQIHPNWAELYKYLGQCHEKAGELGGAINSYMHFISKDPKALGQKELYLHAADLKFQLSKEPDILSGKRKDYWLT